MSIATNDSSRQGIMMAIEANLFQYSLHLGQSRNGQFHDSSKVKWVFTGSPVLNRIFGARLEESEVNNYIDGVLTRFKTWGIPVTWLISPSTRPKQLGDRLAEHGFIQADDWIGMALNISTITEASVSCADLTIREVTDNETLNTWIRVYSVANQMTKYVAAGFHQVFTYLGYGKFLPWRHYVGYWKGTPAITGSLFIGAGVVGLYWIATIPAMRKQGLATSIIKHLLNECCEERAGHAILQSTLMGREVYRKAGFEEYFKMHIYRWHSGLNNQE